MLNTIYKNRILQTIKSKNTKAKLADSVAVMVYTTSIVVVMAMMVFIFFIHQVPKILCHAAVERTATLTIKHHEQNSYVDSFFTVSIFYESDHLIAHHKFTCIFNSCG
jgi:hypothetical protein